MKIKNNCLVLIFIVLGFTGMTIGLCKLIDAEDAQYRKEISYLGYNYQEVSIYCNQFDISLDNFIHSHGLQKQFELFEAGQTTTFMNGLKRRKNYSDNGFATGLAVGYMAGSNK